MRNALRARDRELAAMFHEARGETRWAAMIRANDSSFAEYTSLGQMRLFEGQFVSCDAFDSLNGPPEPARVAAVLERLLAVMAGETIPEVLPALRSFNDVQREGSARSALAAFRQALDMGMMTKAQHSALVYEFVGSWWRTFMESDHEMMRIERRRDAAKEASEKAPASSADAERARIDLERLEKLYNERSDALLASLFRQVGEHAIAGEYMADPRGFETMAEEEWIASEVFER